MAKTRDFHSALPSTTFLGCTHRAWINRDIVSPMLWLSPQADFIGSLSNWTYQDANIGFMIRKSTFYPLGGASILSLYKLNESGPTRLYLMLSFFTYNISIFNTFYIIRICFLRNMSRIVNVVLYNILLKNVVQSIRQLYVVFVFIFGQNSDNENINSLKY